MQIAHGTMDMVLMTNSTLLAILNMTWYGQMGFGRMAKQPLFVPHHLSQRTGGASGQGVLVTTWHEERGLTWVLLGLAGHTAGLPILYAAASRQLQVLLGRVPALNLTWRCRSMRILRSLM